jgi:hypothetical protein
VDPIEVADRDYASAGQVGRERRIAQYLHRC